MTTPDYKALCAQFIDSVDLLCGSGGSPARLGERLILTTHVDALEDLASSARAALAEPEPPADGEVDTRYEFSVLDADCVEQAGGSAPSLTQALDEGRHYLASYEQDGPHTLELRRVEVLSGDHFVDVPKMVEPADGEVAELVASELVRQLRTKAATEEANSCHYSAALLTRAADLLERLASPACVVLKPSPELIEAFKAVVPGRVKAMERLALQPETPAAELIRLRWEAELGFNAELAQFHAAPIPGAELLERLAPQPVPEGPSDDELLELMSQQFRDDLATVSRLASYGTPVGPGIYRVSLNTGALDYARAVLARWGTPNLAQVRSSLGVTHV
jgi:hypothetical protein